MRLFFTGSITQLRLPFLLITLLIVFLSSDTFAKTASHTLLSDISYGQYPEQTLDVYKPLNTKNAPVIFMVHGGAWRIGDKASRKVVANKVKRWVSKGFVFISINYRMLPETDPVTQAKDVREALAFSQNNVLSWGGVPSKFILMGHSAGAHLISLVSSKPVNHRATTSPVRHNEQLKPWLGTISIDSATYDVTQIMSTQKPSRFYKKAFGNKPNYWKASSPLYLMTHKIQPFMAICSAKRKDGACQQAKAFTDKANSLGTKTTLLSVDLSHSETNADLGKVNRYTRSVEDFMATLDPQIARLLTR